MSYSLLKKLDLHQKSL